MTGLSAAALIDNYASLAMRRGRAGRRVFYRDLLAAWTHMGRIDAIEAATRIEKIKERVRVRESGMVR